MHDYRQSNRMSLHTAAIIELEKRKVLALARKEEKQRQDQEALF